MLRACFSITLHRSKKNSAVSVRAFGVQSRSGTVLIMQHCAAGTVVSAKYTSKIVIASPMLFYRLEKHAVSAAFSRFG